MYVDFLKNNFLEAPRGSGASLESTILLVVVVLLVLVISAFASQLWNFLSDWTQNHFFGIVSSNLYDLGTHNSLTHLKESKWLISHINSYLFTFLAFSCYISLCLSALESFIRLNSNSFLGIVSSKDDNLLSQNSMTHLKESKWLIYYLFGSLFKIKSMSQGPPLNSGFWVLFFLHSMFLLLPFPQYLTDSCIAT